jgi:hypothetical protein
LFAIAAVPALGLVTSFKQAQKVYAVVGAAFMPALAIALLVLCSRTAWIGRDARTRVLGAGALVTTLAFFAWAALRS